MLKKIQRGKANILFEEEYLISVTRRSFFSVLALNVVCVCVCASEGMC